MPSNVDLNKLKSSWTKYDIVKLVEITSNNDFKKLVSTDNGIDKPVLKNYLGTDSLADIPSFWEEIESHPKQLKLFALIAACSTHYNILKRLSQSAQKGKMSGKLICDKPNDKSLTNLRSSLVISGASLQNYRREREVPYSFTTLFENGKVGLIVKDLFINRLSRIGLDKSSLEADHQMFVSACDQFLMIDALALTPAQFSQWTLGKELNVEESKFSVSQLKVYSKIPMLRINQWMNEWDDINFNQEEFRTKPKPSFYIFSIDARLLKRLSDVHRRKTSDRTAIQRKQSDQRVNEISNYIEGGFPWSTLSIQDRKAHQDLKMPGILPTAIIINILAPNSKRNGKTLNQNDSLIITDYMNNVTSKDVPFPVLNIPDHIFDENWSPDLKPIEVIDGQHRLWAFDEEQIFNGNYELPVIAFDNLDKAWQAYLFYTINIKPVRINTSLGFDLYPMLRTQNWLESSSDGILAYRENRAQEIVETLWLNSKSPWRNRINMIGESGGPIMSQSAFIRTLVNSFFRKSLGLYASEFTNNDNQILNWNRAQQAAFIILIWDKIKDALKNNTELIWAQKLRGESSDGLTDLAFEGSNSFLTRDQGVRAIMVFVNDFFFKLMNESIIDLNKYVWDEVLVDSVITEEAIDESLKIFQEDSVFIELIQSLAKNIIKVDWRTASAKFDNESERRTQLIYKGSTGYAEFYKTIKEIFEKTSDEKLKEIISKM